MFRELTKLHFQFLALIAKVEELKAELQAMNAANAEAEEKGFVVAYGELEFLAVKLRLQDVVHEADELGKSLETPPKTVNSMNQLIIEQTKMPNNEVLTAMQRLLEAFWKEQKEDYQDWLASGNKATSIEEAQHISDKLRKHPFTYMVTLFKYLKANFHLPDTTITDEGFI